MKRVLFCLIVILFSFSLYSQEEEKKGVLTRATILNGETVPVLWIKEVFIIAPKTFRSKSQAIEWTKLVQNVKKVYPYAKIAGVKMKEFNEVLRPIDSKRLRKEKVKAFEKSMFDGFESDIKKLTFSQGKILIKLIDRETGTPAYDIIREYKGGLMAGFWQTLGRIFGYNLREDYDPDGKDREIETIVLMIERGAI